MQILVIRSDADVRRLLGSAGAPALDALQRLNPHLDLRTLAPGAVLVVPARAGDPAAAAVEGASPLGAEALDEFVGMVKASLAGTQRRLRLAAERAQAEEQALAAAAQSRVVSQATARDRELGALLDEALRRAKTDAAGTAGDARDFGAFADAVFAEVEALARSAS